MLCLSPSPRCPATSGAVGLSPYSAMRKPATSGSRRGGATALGRTARTKNCLGSLRTVPLCPGVELSTEGWRALGNPEVSTVRKPGRGEKTAHGTLASKTKTTHSVVPFQHAHSSSLKACDIKRQVGGGFHRTRSCDILFRGLYQPRMQR